MRVIGLTGGIACGKSTAGEFLRAQGVPVIDADRISRDITRKGRPGALAIVELFPDAVSADGEVDRTRLASVVFSDPEQRVRLERALHPLIQAEMAKELEEARRSGADVAAMDVPLLFEAGMEGMADEVWVVHVPREEQIRRLCERDGLTREQAEARIASQMPVEDKVARADVAIFTGGGMEETRALVGAALAAAREREARSCGR